MHKFRAHFLILTLTAIAVVGGAYVASEILALRADHFAKQRSTRVATATPQEILAPQPERIPERYVAPAPVIGPFY